ncbi:MAG: LicD family protein [Lachnospiraceae bacterium]|nr:LicD family protein [Lachnospiraceae bacterium]
MKREEIIRLEQKRQLDMLKQFDAVCKKHDIQYFCAFGTVLGAVRHHGFIPWDDDIDIGIMREDFKKLCKVPEEEWGDDYLLLAPDTDDVRHDKLFARLYLKKSRIQSYQDVEGWRNYKDNSTWSTSLMLDIFVFDYVPENAAERTKIYQTIHEKFAKRYLISKIKPITNSHNPKEKCKVFMKQILGRTLRLIHKKPWKFYYDKYNALVEKYNGGTKIGCFATTGFSGSAYNAVENIWYYDYKDFFPTVTLEFEDMQIPAPNAWDKLLHLWYDGQDGDYMQFPPEGQRYHINFIYLDFGDGTSFVIDAVKGSLGEGKKTISMDD